MSLKLVTDNTNPPPNEPSISYSFEITYKTENGLETDYVEGYPIIGGVFLSIMSLQDGVGVPVAMYNVADVKKVVQVKKNG